VDNEFVRSSRRHYPQGPQAQVVDMWTTTSSLPPHIHNPTIMIKVHNVKHMLSYTLIEEWAEIHIQELKKYFADGEIAQESYRKRLEELKKP
jgi:hypothetical protein